MDGQWSLKGIDVIGLHPALCRLAQWVGDGFGLRLITSASRPGDSGVHGALPVRGLDLRCRDQALGRRVERAVRAAWVYDPARPWLHAALYHDAGSGLHLHLQVCDETTPRQADQGDGGGEA